MANMAYIILLVGLVVGGLCAVCGIYSRKLELVTLQNTALQNEIDEWRVRVLNKLIETLNARLKQSELELRAHHKIENPSQTKIALEAAQQELKTIFAETITALNESYPELTDLDIFVLLLIGIGFDNVEIATLLGMEKRTLYRRRQLISQRMGISSLEIDEKVKSLVTF